MQTQAGQKFIVTWRVKYPDASCVGGYDARLFFIPVVAPSMPDAVDLARQDAIKYAHAWFLEHGIGELFREDRMVATTVETPAEHQKSRTSAAREEKERQKMGVLFGVMFFLLLVLGGAYNLKLILS